MAQQVTAITPTSEIPEELKSFWREYQLREPVPQRLYHYTTLDALVPIVGYGKLWCSNVKYSNDPSEIALGHRLIASVTRETLNEPDSEALDFVVKQFDYFVAAFSTEPDSLPQWRSYSRNGHGIALGFDTFGLARATKLLVDRVEYDPKCQEDLIRSVVELYDRYIKSHPADSEIAKRSAAGPYAFALIRLAGIFKDAAYKGENEYRLWTWDALLPGYEQKPKQFRSTESAIVPYLNADIKGNAALPLTSVVIGPCLDFELTQSGVRQFLESKDCRAKVCQSKVKMRA
jgi:hypothetical protein